VTIDASRKASNDRFERLAGMGAAKRTLTKDGLGCAPCKGGVFQWVRVPPGKCSSRKLPEQLWR
jgi:hypothetical protein